jgi:hypothetical protein
VSICLPPNRESPFEYPKCSVQQQHTAITGGNIEIALWCVPIDVGLPLLFHLGDIGTCEPGHIREKALALYFVRLIVQAHRETADRTRKALRHFLDGANRLPAEPCGHHGSLVDASSALLSREVVGANL